MEELRIGKKSYDLLQDAILSVSAEPQSGLLKLHVRDLERPWDHKTQPAYVDACADQGFVGFLEADFGYDPDLGRFVLRTIGYNRHAFYASNEKLDLLLTQGGKPDLVTVHTGPILHLRENGQLENWLKAGYGIEYISLQYTNGESPKGCSHSNNVVGSMEGAFREGYACGEGLRIRLFPDANEALRDDLTMLFNGLQEKHQ